MIRFANMSLQEATSEAAKMADEETNPTQLRHLRQLVEWLWELQLARNAIENVRVDISKGDRDSPAFARYYRC